MIQNLIYPQLLNVKGVDEDTSDNTCLLIADYVVVVNFDGFTLSSLVLAVTLLVGDDEEPSTTIICIERPAILIVEVDFDVMNVEAIVILPGDKAEWLALFNLTGSLNRIANPILLAVRVAPLTVYEDCTLFLRPLFKDRLELENLTIELISCVAVGGVCHIGPVVSIVDVGDDGSAILTERELGYIFPVLLNWGGRLRGAAALDVKL